MILPCSTVHFLVRGGLGSHIKSYVWVLLTMKFMPLNQVPPSVNLICYLVPRCTTFMEFHIVCCLQKIMFLLCLGPIQLVNLPKLNATAIFRRLKVCFCIFLPFFKLISGIWICKTLETLFVFVAFMILPFASKGEANKYSIPYRCAAKSTDYWLVVCSNLHLNFTLGSIHHFPKKRVSWLRMLICRCDFRILPFCYSDYCTLPRL